MVGVGKGAKVAGTGTERCRGRGVGGHDGRGNDVARVFGRVWVGGRGEVGRERGMRGGEGGGTGEVEGEEERKEERDEDDWDECERR